MGTVAFVIITTSCYVAPLVFYGVMRYRYPEHELQLTNGLLRYGQYLQNMPQNRTIIFDSTLPGRPPIAYRDKNGKEWYCSS